MNVKTILVLGAGVSGLTTGIQLIQSGCSVTIWAKDVPPNTTSNKAAAVWYPYMCFPRDKAISWAKTTFEYLRTECLRRPESGCITRSVTELFDTPQEDPWWKDGFPGVVRRLTKEQLPDGYVDAYQIDSIVIDTSLYMSYLLKKFADLGGTVIQKEVTNINEAFADFDTVINCTGLGSYTLFNDKKLYPVRGQMIKIKATGFSDVVVDDAGPNVLSLVVPRVSDIMLGGTVQENNWNTQVDPQDTKEILRKVALIAPNLKNIELISEQVGLRPARDEVRLEKETYPNGKTVVHNYGHGGAGLTLSWGCAKDVVAIVKSL